MELRQNTAILSQTTVSLCEFALIFEFFWIPLKRWNISTEYKRSLKLTLESKETNVFCFCLWRTSRIYDFFAIHWILPLLEFKKAQSFRKLFRDYYCLPLFFISVTDKWQRVWATLKSVLNYDQSQNRNCLLHLTT